MERSTKVDSTLSRRPYQQSPRYATVRSIGTCEMDSDTSESVCEAGLARPSDQANIQLAFFVAMKITDVTTMLGHGHIDAIGPLCLSKHRRRHDRIVHVDQDGCRYSNLIQTIPRRTFLVIVERIGKTCDARCKDVIEISNRANRPMIALGDLRPSWPNR